MGSGRDRLPSDECARPALRYTTSVKPDVGVHGSHAPPAQFPLHLGMRVDYEQGMFRPLKNLLVEPIGMPFLQVIFIQSNICWNFFP